MRNLIEREQGFYGRRGEPYGVVRGVEHMRLSVTPFPHPYKRSPDAAYGNTSIAQAVGKEIGCLVVELNLSPVALAHLFVLKRYGSAGFKVAQILTLAGTVQLHDKPPLWLRQGMQAEQSGHPRRRFRHGGFVQITEASGTRSNT